MIFKDFAIFEDTCENGPQKLPKELPGGQNGAQERLRKRPERPKRRQEVPKTTPRAAQERPKSRPRGEKKEQKRSPCSVVVLGWLPGGRRERFWPHFGDSGGRFSSLRRAILESFFGALCGHVLRSEVERSPRNFNVRHVPSLLFLGQVHCFFGSELCSKETQANVGKDLS